MTDSKNLKAGESFVDSSEVDGEKAGKELVERAKEDASIDQVDFAILFVSSDFKVEKLVDGADKSLDDEASWIGSTTAGEISKEGSTKGGASMLVVESDKEIDFYTSYSRSAIEKPEEKGSELIQDIEKNSFYKKKNSLLYVINPGPTVKNKNLDYGILKGLQKELAEEIPVVGATSADDYRLRSTKQIIGGEIFEDAVVGAGINTEKDVFVGQETGLNEKKATGIVTESEGRIIKEISGEPAAEFYAENTDTSLDKLKENYSLPLKKEIKLLPTVLKRKLKGQDSVFVDKVFEYALENTLADEVGGELRVALPYRVREGNALETAVEIPENRTIHIISGDENDIVNAGKKAFKEADSDRTLFSLISDCSCRNQFLRHERLQDEIRELRKELDCPMVGIYGMGEIGGREGNMCTFKNQTVTGFAILEKE